MGRLASAHDGFGVAFSTAVALLLTILAVSWGPWSQADMLISEEENEVVDSGTEEMTYSGSEEVWGTEYLSKCPGCTKISKLTMTRSPTDWCVSLKQLVFQPWERRRRMGDVLTTHVNYTTWTNSSCISELEGDYLADNFCNDTWKSLRQEACDMADTEIGSWPNSTVFPYSFWRWVKLQCTMYDNVCAGTSNVMALDVVGLIFLLFATATAIGGPFLGDKYKLTTIVTVALLSLAWIMLISATCVYGLFNTSLNAPRDLYVKMLVHGEGTQNTEYYNSDPVSTIFGTGTTYDDVRNKQYTWYPALKPKGPIADYIDTQLQTKARWDWAPWTFSMGFFANVSALMWLSVALCLAIYTLVSLMKPPMKEKEIS